MSELTLTEFSRNIGRSTTSVHRLKLFLPLPETVTIVCSGWGKKKYYRESDLVEWYQKAREIKSAK